MSYCSRNPRIRRAARIINNGGVVAYPTEAVWGLGCDPFDQSAVQRILALKRREAGMGLILVASRIEQLEPFLNSLTPQQISTLEASWPGPNTWLVPDNGVAPGWITGGRPTLALRVSAHPLVCALCDAAGGPIVSTSANPHGFQPARTALKVHCYFGGRVDDVLPGVVGKTANPSCIRELATGHIIRNG